MSSMERKKGGGARGGEIRWRYTRPDTSRTKAGQIIIFPRAPTREENRVWVRTHRWVNPVIFARSAPRISPVNPLSSKNLQTRGG